MVEVNGGIEEKQQVCRLFQTWNRGFLLVGNKDRIIIYPTVM